MRLIGLGRPFQGRQGGAESPALLCVAFLLVAASVSIAQDLHPADYPQADIEYGARIYAAQCSTCHLPTGDGIGGVNLRSGTFRNARRSIGTSSGSSERARPAGDAAVRAGQRRDGGHHRLPSQHERVRHRRR